MHVQRVALVEDGPMGHAELGLWADRRGVRSTNVDEQAARGAPDGRVDGGSRHFVGALC